MTTNNKLTCPWGGPGTQSQIGVGLIPTNLCWNFNPDDNEWELVKIMPEGTDDLIESSSRSKSAAKMGYET